jgi:membrane protein implicated in regulation of membrane protease activity
VPWWAWAVLALLVGLAELHASGSYLVWIACGAAFTAAVDAALELPLAAQLVTFAAASAVSCGAGYFVYRRSDRRRPERTPLNQRDLALVGARGVVCTNIENGEGKVRMGDTVWLAEGPPLPEGASVVVRSVRGTRVVVEPVAPDPARR